MKQAFLDTRHRKVWKQSTRLWQPWPQILKWLVTWPAATGLIHILGTRSLVGTPLDYCTVCLMLSQRRGSSPCDHGKQNKLEGDIESRRGLDGVRTDLRAP